VEPDKRYVHFYKSKVSRMDKIQKDPTKPSPGEYNTVDAFHKTQTKNAAFRIGTQKIKCFIDDIQQQKSFLPGIGAYKVHMKAYESLSKSPRAMRVLRH